jgi:hypothetical protein
MRAHITFAIALSLNLTIFALPNAAQREDVVARPRVK